MAPVGLTTRNFVAGLSTVKVYRAPGGMVTDDKHPCCTGCRPAWAGGVRVCQPGCSAGRTRAAPGPHPGVTRAPLGRHSGATRAPLRS
jgi:hypothetical protein